MPKLISFILILFFVAHLISMRNHWATFPDMKTLADESKAANIESAIKKMMHDTKISDVTAPDAFYVSKRTPDLHVNNAKPVVISKSDEGAKTLINLLTFRFYVYDKSSNKFSPFDPYLETSENKLLWSQQENPLSSLNCQMYLQHAPKYFSKIFGNALTGDTFEKNVGYVIIFTPAESNVDVFTSKHWLISFDKKDIPQKYIDTNSSRKAYVAKIHLKREISDMNHYIIDLYHAFIPFLAYILFKFSNTGAKNWFKKYLFCCLFFIVFSYIMSLTPSVWMFFSGNTISSPFKIIFLIGLFLAGCSVICLSTRLFLVNYFSEYNLRKGKIIWTSLLLYSVGTVSLIIPFG